MHEMEKLYELIEKMIPVFSTCIGAAITYYFNVAVKKNELKMNAQAGKRDKYLVPCSVALENLQLKVSELSETDCYVRFKGKKSCEKEFLELIKYQQADKRIYFRKNIRNLLTNLVKQVEIYEHQVNNIVGYILEEYRVKYCSMLENFPLYKKKNYMRCSITMKKTFKEEIKKALLEHKKVRWFGQITCIKFIKGVYPHIEMLTIDMTWPKGDLYYDVWLPIKDYGNRKEDFSLSPNQELALDILDYECSNLDKYIFPFVYLVDELVTFENEYVPIFEIMSILKTELENNIDEFADL